VCFNEAGERLVLRGFSRNVKQDSEASNASGGESEANVAIACCGKRSPPLRLKRGTLVAKLYALREHDDVGSAMRRYFFNV
jgi:hypothetical protein